jgi:hypothetical protein
MPCALFFTNCIGCALPTGRHADKLRRSFALVYDWNTNDADNEGADSASSKASKKFRETTECLNHTVPTPSTPCT